MASHRLVHPTPRGLRRVAVAQVDQGGRHRHVELRSRHAALLVHGDGPARVGPGVGQLAAHQAEHGECPHVPHLPERLPRHLHQLPHECLGAVEVAARFRQARTQHQHEGVPGRPLGEQAHRLLRLGELTQADLGLRGIDIQGPLGRGRGHAAQRQGLGLGEPALAVQGKRQVVQGDEVLRIHVERGPVRVLGLVLVQLGDAVVVRLGEITLQRGEPIAMLEGPRGDRAHAGLGGAGVVQRDRQLAVPHGERRVEGDGLGEERDRPFQLAGVRGPHPL